MPDIGRHELDRLGKGALVYFHDGEGSGINRQSQAGVVGRWSQLHPTRRNDYPLRDHPHFCLGHRINGFSGIMSARNIFNNPHVFALSQRLIPFTGWVYDDLIRRNVSIAKGRVLDIGCGLGAHRKFFPEAYYHGLDINPGYIEKAHQMYGGGFEVMDATRLKFSGGTYDLTLCVAVFHHLDDAQVLAAIRESWRVVLTGGSVHIIDAILPTDPGAWLKRWVFTNDRGRFQRTEQQMRTLASQVGPIAQAERVNGRLHDVIYLRLDKS